MDIDLMACADRSVGDFQKMVCFMNKSYRSVWNDATGTWCAVQETAPSRGKRTSSRLAISHVLPAAAVGAAVLSASLFASQAIASTVDGTGAQAIAAHDTAIGDNAYANSKGAPGSGVTDYATAVGYDSSAIGDSAVALGNGAQAGTSALASSYVYATAVGPMAQALAYQSTALGANSLANYDNAMALGAQASAQSTAAMAIGAQSTVATGADRAIAIGYNSVVSSGATDAFAIGTNASVTSADGMAIGSSSVASGNNTVAIGYGATAATNNSVALGSGSTTGTAVSTSSGVIGGTTYTYAGGSAAGTVSVGTASTNRTITNVAAGQVTATSTDAVNGSELYATNTQVTANTNAISQLQGQAADAVMYDSAAHDSVTLGGADATTPVALHNVAAGAVNATSTDAVNGSQLYGVASSTASALGGGSTVNPDGTITAPSYSIGGQTFNNAGDALTNLDGRTTANTDAIANLQAAGADAVMYDSSAHDSVTFGGVGATIPVALHNVAAGTLTATSTDAVNGSQLYATNQQVAKNTANIAQNTTDISNLQTSVTNMQGQVANTVSYDSDAHDSITLGGAGATTAVALHNVAAGTADTDAVNVGQMNSAIASISNEAAAAVNPFVAADGNRDTEGALASGTHATAIGANAKATAANSVALGAGSVADRDNTVSVGSAGNERQITNVAAGTQGTDAVNLNQLNAATAQSQGYVDSRIAGVQNQISSVRDAAFGAAAAAMAVAGLPQPNMPGKTMVAAGASHIGGQTGMALGVSYATENSHWIGKLAASSSTQGSTGVTVGAGYQW
jgi:trimeric autotransporter adhesin